MTHIADDFRAWAIAQPSVSALIGTRFRPEQLSQNIELPAIVFTVISTIPEHNVATGDANYSQTRIQVDVYGDSPVTSQQVMNALRKTSGLQGFRGDMNGTFVHNVVCETAYNLDSDPPTDGSDKHRFIVSADFIIGHEDT